VEDVSLQCVDSHEDNRDVMTGDHELDDLSAYLKDLVDSYWNSNRAALLLADLGTKIRREHPEYVGSLTEGLNKYIVRTGVAKAVRHPTLDQKVGLVPIDLPLPEDLSELFRPRSKPKHPKLLRDFWIAFQSPVRETRFVVIKKDNRIEVRDSFSRSEGEDAHEILKSDVVTSFYPTPQDKTKATWEKIESWIKREGLDLSLFEEASQPMSSHSHSPRAEQAVHSGNWLQVFSRLDQQDLSRISIPLDIVAKLLSSR
jgi:hypothetical protein